MNRQFVPTKLALFIAAESLLLAVVFNIRDLPTLLAIPKFAVGMIAFVVIPGNVIGKLLPRTKRCLTVLETTWVGLMLQSFNLFLFYCFDSLLGGTLAGVFGVFIPAVTIAEMLLALVYQGDLQEPIIKLQYPRDLPSIGFLSALAIGVLYLMIVGAFVAPDAALFCDIGRYVLRHGVIGSNVFNDGYANPFTASLGLTSHMGTALGFAFSFFMGTSDSLFAHLFAVIMGASSVGLILKPFETGPRILGMVLVPVLSLIPIVLHYSTSVYGPEISSLFLTLSALTTLELGLKSETGTRVRYALFMLSGTLTFLEFFSWGGNQLPLLIAEGLLVLFYLRTSREFKFSSLIFSLISFGVLAFLPKVSVNILVWVGGLAVFSSVCVVFILLRVPLSREISVLSFSVFTLCQLSLARSYMHPEIHILSAPVSAQFQVISAVAQILPTLESLISSLIYLVLYVGPVQLLLAGVSVFFFKKEAKIIYALIGGYLVFQILGRPVFTIAEPRFYVGIVLCFTALSIFSVWSISLALVNRLGVENATMNKHRTSRYVPALVLVSVILVSLCVNLNGYQNNYSTVQWFFPANNGWPTVQEWFLENATEEDNLLVMGSPRDWGWFLDRQAIGFRSWHLGQMVPTDEMNVTHLIEHIKEYSIDLILVDTTALWTRRWPNLSLLYDEPEVGSTLVLHDGVSSYNLTCELTSMSSATSTYVAVYRVVENDWPMPFYKEDFELNKGWHANNATNPMEAGDIASISNGVLVLDVSASEEWDFDGVNTDSISIPSIDVWFRARFRVNSSSVRAVYFRFTVNNSLTGNWVQWYYSNPRPDIWMDAQVLLSDLIGLDGRHSEIIPTEIESVGVIALLEQDQVSRIEVDFIYVGLIRMENSRTSSEETQSPLLTSGIQSSVSRTVTNGSAVYNIVSFFNQLKILEAAFVLGPCTDTQDSVERSTLRVAERMSILQSTLTRSAQPATQSRLFYTELDWD